MKKSRAPEEPTIRTRRRLMVNWCLTILVLLRIAWPETRESGGRHGTTGAAISEDRSRCTEMVQQLHILSENGCALEDCFGRICGRSVWVLYASLSLRNALRR